MYTLLSRESLRTPGLESSKETINVSNANILISPLYLKLLAASHLPLEATGRQSRQQEVLGADNKLTSQPPTASACCCVVVWRHRGGKAGAVTRPQPGIMDYGTQPCNKISFISPVVIYTFISECLIFTFK